MKNEAQGNMQNDEGKGMRWWKTRQARIAGWITGSLILIGIIIWWFAFRPYVSTDDARVDADIVRVSNQGASGQINKIFVNEGDRVSAGAVLVELDHRTAEAQLEKAKARSDFSSHELVRMKNLEASQGTSKQQLDRTRTETDISSAELTLAQIALERTYMKSPVNGIVIQKLAQEGNILETNQTAITIADLENAWITANIEETDIGLVRPGQHVSISIDEGGSIKGTVLEVRKATAATFALIPSDSAQGNFIKQVQRIPVKISIDPGQKRILRVGQSVEIDIRVR